MQKEGLRSSVLETYPLWGGVLNPIWCDDERCMKSQEWGRRNQESEIRNQKLGMRHEDSRIESSSAESKAAHCLIPLHTYKYFPIQIDIVKSQSQSHIPAAAWTVR